VAIWLRRLDVAYFPAASTAPFMPPLTVITPINPPKANVKIKIDAWPWSVTEATIYVSNEVVKPESGFPVIMDAPTRIPINRAKWASWVMSARMMAIKGGPIDNQVNDSPLRGGVPLSPATPNPINMILNIERIFNSFTIFMARKLNPEYVFANG